MDHTGFSELLLVRIEAREECYEQICTRQGDLKGRQTEFILALSCAASSWLWDIESNTPVPVQHVLFMYDQITLGALNGLSQCSVIVCLGGFVCLFIWGGPKLLANQKLTSETEEESLLSQNLPSTFFWYLRCSIEVTVYAVILGSEFCIDLKISHF